MEDTKHRYIALLDPQVMRKDLLIYGNHYYDYRTGERLDPRKVVLVTGPVSSDTSGRFVVAVSIKSVQVDIEEDEQQLRDYAEAIRRSSGSEVQHNGVAMGEGDAESVSLSDQGEEE